MKRALVIGLVLVGIVVLAVIFFNITNATGNTTLTSNADYAVIDRNNLRYSNCIYLSDNDGWDVTLSGEVKYFNRLNGMEFTKKDECITRTKVREYNCIDGFMMERAVICPANMVCKEGICVTPKI